MKFPRHALVATLVLTATPLALPAQPAAAPTAAHDAKMSWWREARFGMFIHWGPYAILGGAYNGREQRHGPADLDGAEWVMNHMKIPVAEYQKIAATFNPVNYDPESWVLLAKQAGMKYIVITAKHHDGFAIFKSEASPFNIVDHTPYKKDPLALLAAACRKHGMKLGFYYSQAQDWNNPGGAAIRKKTAVGWDNPRAPEIDAYTLAHRGHWDPAQQTRTFDEYIDQVALPQVRELLANYGDIAIIWWDTPASMTPAQAQKFAALLKAHPQIITNNRLISRNPDYPGDFMTPEQRIPATDRTDDRDLEACMTLNGTWGYSATDRNWKSPAQLIRNLMTIASYGGNYLLNIGPDALGQIPQPSIDRLKTIGAWLKTNGEALYATQASPLKKPVWGAITRRDTPTTTTLYLTIFTENYPPDGKLLLRANLPATTARLLATNASLPCKKTPQGIHIQLPAAAPDKIATVIKLDLANKLPTRKAIKESGKTYDIAD